MRIFGLLLTFLLVHGCSTFGNNPNAIGRVESITGQPTLIRSNQLLNLGVGMPILSGDSIVTKGDERTQLKMRDGTTFALEPDTELTLHAWSNTSVAVVSSTGEVTVDPGRLARKNDTVFELRTPFAVISPGKGRFWVAHQSDHLQVLMLEAGNVTVSNKDGSITMTKQNEATAVRFVGEPEKASIFAAN